MNEPKQDKPPKWRRHLDQGVTTIALAATVGLAGCVKTPEEELREAAYQAAEKCSVTPPPQDKRGRQRKSSTLGAGAVNVSIPCDMANDKAAIDKHVAQAAAACANPGKDATTIYHNGDFIASCTRIGETNKVPLQTALVPSAAASAPEKGNAKPEKRSFADRAASAPTDTQSAGR